MDQKDLKMDSLKKAALAYAALNWRVFPLVAGGKTPITAHGVKDATCDAKRIDEWWTRTPDANIGLACGNGIAVIDVDCHKGTDGKKSINDAGLEVPASLVQWTPSGGYHVVCAAAGVGNATNVNGLQGVDVRGEGGYIVASPSVVNGVRYEWENWGSEIGPFPDWARKRKDIQQPAPVASAVRSEDMSATVERARAYLAKMEPAIQGAGGHVALLKAAEVVAVRFALPDDVAKNLLWESFNPRCRPPWNYGNQKERKDFERKVDEAKRHPQHPLGDLRDATCPSLVMSQEAVDAGRAIVFGKGKTMHALPSAEEDAETRRIILNPPGVVGEIANWIAENSITPIPLFAVTIALSLVGCVFARNVTHGKTMTNPFFFLVAPPGSGKTTIFNLAATVFREIQRRAGCENRNFFFLTEATSDSAILAHLQKEGRLTMVVDECTGFFAEIKGSARTGGRLASVKGAIKNLYSVTKDGNIQTKLYAPDHGKERESFSCPGACFSFVGGTQPGVLKRVLDDGEICDGFLARMIFVAQSAIARKRTDAMDATTPMPEGAIDALADFMRSTMGDISAIGAQTYMDMKIKADVPLSPEAYAMREELVDWEHEQLSTGDFVVQNLCGRVVENVTRVALVVAAGMDPRHVGGATIGRDAFAFAKTFVMHAYNDLVQYARDLGDSSDYDKYKVKILEYMNRTVECRKSDIAKYVRGAKSKKYRDEAISDLIESGQIIEEGSYLKIASV